VTQSGRLRGSHRSPPRTCGAPSPGTQTGAAEGARHGYRTARTELGEAVPPHAVDAALAAYRDEGRRLVAAARAAELVESALRGDAL
jgi:hypothetical protein